MGQEVCASFLQEDGRKNEIRCHMPEQRISVQAELFVQIA